MAYSYKTGERTREEVKRRRSEREGRGERRSEVLGELGLIHTKVVRPLKRKV